MKGRTRLAIALVVCAGLGLGTVALVCIGLSPNSLGKTTAWTLQPDQVPLGAVLQGSQVEMTIGVLSRRNPAPMPSIVSQLPRPLENMILTTAEALQRQAARLSLRAQVEAPSFITIVQKSIEFHPAHGPYVVVSMRLKTTQPGAWRGNLVLHLSGGGYGTTNLIVPLSAEVIAAPPSLSSTALVTTSPYQEFSTQDGSYFQGLASANTTLAQRGVRVDFLHELPRQLSLYRTILVADSEMASLTPSKTEQLKEFVAKGGRLILAANAFFVPTVPTANRLLEGYGLQIIDQDAGLAITSLQVISDALTTGITNVDFHRPSLIHVTDPAQGRILVEATEGDGGFVAVSRRSSRGEVIVLTQSLWWSWIRSDPSTNGNRRLFENLLAN
jgi:hypothetical protein